jgi:hypothetical protein
VGPAAWRARRRRPVAQLWMGLNPSARALRCAFGLHPFQPRAAAKRRDALAARPVRRKARRGTVSPSLPPPIHASRWSSLDDVIARANASDYGLAAGIFRRGCTHARTHARTRARTHARAHDARGARRSPMLARQWRPCVFPPPAQLQPGHGQPRGPRPEVRGGLRKQPQHGGQVGARGRAGGGARARACWSVRVCVRARARAAARRRPVGLRGRAPVPAPKTARPASRAPVCAAEASPRPRLHAPAPPSSPRSLTRRAAPCRSAATGTAGLGASTARTAWPPTARSRRSCSRWWPRRGADAAGGLLLGVAADTGVGARQVLALRSALRSNGSTRSRYTSWVIQC